jgi:hypothetical protein
MGCESAPLYLFAKGRGPLMAPFFHYAASWLVIDKPSNPPSHVFKRARGSSADCLRT